MRRWVRYVVALLFMLGGIAVKAQESAAGSWQGTLEAGKSLRCVLQVTKADSGFAGKFYSIDQGSGALATGQVSVAGGSLRLAGPSLGAKYEGKLSADGKTATGTWSQGGASLPLVLSHVNADAAWSTTAGPQKLTPMPANADPSFEVATIKPSQPDQQSKMLRVQGQRFIVKNMSLNDMITFAYDLHAKEIVGAPAWAAAEKYDIEATPDVPGQPNVKQLQSMVRKFLAERFQLKFHNEKRELAVYAVEPGKTGPKLTKSGGDPNGLPALFFQGLGKLSANNATMADFAQLMQGAVLDRPVVDQTELTGRYDFTLNWTPDESQFGGLGARVPPPSDAANAPPNLYTAVAEQLGLKLEPTRAAVPVLVVDRVEKPSEN